MFYYWFNGPQLKELTIKRFQIDYLMLMANNYKPLRNMLESQPRS